MGDELCLRRARGLALDRGNHSEAAHRYQESLAAALEAGDAILIGDGLVHLGVVALAFGDTPRAVQLFGAAEALRERTNQPVPPYLQDDYEATLLKAREALGRNAFAELWMWDVGGRWIRP